MKSINHFSSVYFKILSLAAIIVMVMGTVVNALHMTKMPKNIQTTMAEPQMRKISLKLPLQQPVFHWTFMNKEDFLAGKLVLRIKRGDEIAEINIFEDGKISKGWKALTLPDNPKAGEVYFGFESSEKYATEPNDILEIELHVNKDLDGIGAVQTGVLLKGIYKAQGTYSGLIDKYKMPESIKGVPKETLDKLKKMYEFKAFLENWKQQWNLNITGDDGWLPPEQRQSFEKLMEQMKQEEESTNSIRPSGKTEVEVEGKVDGAKQVDARQLEVTATKANATILHNAVLLFKLDTGRYPSEEAGLIELVERPKDIEGWCPGGYLKQTCIPQDAWKNEFVYMRNSKGGKPFVIISYGADGEEGGVGYNRDIYSTDFH
jgi:general secretion pathway protein G